MKLYGKHFTGIEKDPILRRYYQKAHFFDLPKSKEPEKEQDQKKNKEDLWNSSH
jgi:hypothetical protein